MRDLAYRTYATLTTSGVDPRRMVRSLRVRSFLRDLRAYRALGGSIDNLLPILGDASEDAAQLDPHYFQIDLLAAQKVYAAAPARHIDVGSRIDGFVAHVASFRQIEVIDIRVLPRLFSDNIVFLQADAMSPAEETTMGLADSISSLHAVEHFGLGRYGDAIDPEGHIKGLAFLESLVTPGGRLYVALPVGRSRTVFNAHRVLDPTFVPRKLKHSSLLEFDYVDDHGRLHRNVNPAGAAMCNYGCGLYTFERD